MCSARIHYDVSSIFDGRDARLTGIPRTELEIGRRLMGEGAQAIRWDYQRATFVTVDFARDVEPIAQGRRPAPRTRWGQRLRQWRDGRGRPVAFGTGDVLVSLSIWWSQPPLETLVGLRRQTGIELVGWVHDLIPIRRPDFFAGGVDIPAFRSFIDTLLGHASALCTGSTHVARDVAALADEQHLALPPMQVVPLCSDLPRRVSPMLTPALAEHGLEPGRFALMVSSINPRKNHAWAYRLWRQAFDMLGPDLPPLVFAGARGWGDDELFRLLDADGRHVTFVASPSDAELAWLYQNCAYTIFPSQMEGWGLPISESLSFGRYCLAADNSSLREAGAGLAFHADLDDEQAWLAEIVRLARRPSHLVAQERRIANLYRPRSWDDVASGVRDAIEMARQNSRRLSRR